MNIGIMRGITADQLREHIGEKTRIRKDIGLLGSDSAGFYLRLLELQPENGDYCWKETGAVYRIRCGDPITLTRPSPHTFKYS